MASISKNRDGRTSLEIIAFQLHGQSFCIETTSIREIRGWAASTPIPHAPPEMVGIINLRGVVIPTIDLCRKLGMPSSEATERSAIVVAEVHGKPIGLLVDQVTDMLSINADDLQQAPEIVSSPDRSYCEGIITHQSGMICFLSLTRMFTDDDEALAA
ncbi:chemotaxis protein CheW [Rhizobium leguminosarum]|uniref:chemotaxis protein CheW n=1 Tax=Rhizobium leguminosarum TaxID=384 RepID=UPI0014412853|nr:chemotaxis protein CheW [Rhizobium leguminosarum]MBY5869830.1 purine-binding chemotaxis protein CheW [Rhizobium leguminosarum]NKM09040.1 chemotaxis protein CheW [Rhizobium leguminosarum bv. viciae]